MLVVVASTALVLAVALAAILVAFARMSRNVGPLSLEDYALRQGVVFIPVSKDLVASLREPSKPVRIRLDTHRHPLLAELIISEPDPSR